jgi:hypothetical protein
LAQFERAIGKQGSVRGYPLAKEVMLKANLEWFLASFAECVL